MEPIRVVFLGTGDAYSAGGRNQAAILVEHPRVTLLMDCGAMTLAALNRHKTPIASIDAILLSHLHGDHFAGLPFLFLYYIYIEPRVKPLRILGPEGLEDRILQLFRDTYPGDSSNPLPFPVEFTEIRIDGRYSVDILEIEPFRARHQENPPSFGYSINLDGRRIVYTGDTGWTDELPERAKGADLFICECSFYDSQIDIHLDYPTIDQRLRNCGYKKMVLTHLGQEVLERSQDLDLKLAYDGSVVIL
jgi:ribonuclease BN (tRNA processing enzyme)